jgi:Ca2+-binding EF-hand superfamily protein
MGNVMNMGYSTPTDASETPVQDDYVQRLSAPDLKRYTDGFRRVCRVDSDHNGGGMGGGQLPPLAPAPSFPPKGSRRGNGNGSVNPVSGNGIAASSMGGPGLTKKLFRSKLLSAFPLIPHSLSDRLFEVLDTDQRSELSVETVLRGIALLKHGTRDEHLQLLFTIYDLDNTGLVARDMLDRFMDVIYGRKKARNAVTVGLLNRVFNGRATLTLNEFKQIAEEKDAEGHAVLLEWLYALSDRIGRVDDEQIVELEKKYNPVVIRHRIAETTLFSPSEVSSLEKQFHKLFDTKGGASNRIPCEQFIDLLTQHEFPRHILEKACEAKRMTVPGMVLFDEFCQILSNCCRGMAEPRCHRLFELYASEVDDGETRERSISRKEVEELLALTLADALNGHGKLNGHSKYDKHAVREYILDVPL